MPSDDLKIDDLKPSGEFPGQLALAVLGGLGVIAAVLALMVVAYLSAPKRNPVGPIGGASASVTGRGDVP